MSDVEDWIISAVHRKYYSEYARRIGIQKSIIMPSDPFRVTLGDTVNLTVSALASCYYDKECKELIIEATAGSSAKNGDIAIRCALTKDGLKDTKDICMVVDKLLSNMRREIIEMMVKAIEDENPNQTPTE